MHRMKIGLVAAIVLLAFTGRLYAVVTQELKDSIVHEVETDVSRGQRMHQSIARLEALDFANLVAGLRHRPAVVGVFDKADETGRRQAAFEQCEELNALPADGRLAQGRHRRDHRLGRQGRGARPQRQRDVRRGPALQVPGRRAAPCTARRPRTSGRFGAHDPRGGRTDHSPRRDHSRARCWSATSSTRATRRLKRDLLGMEVAYFHDGKVHTSSFVSEGDGRERQGGRQQDAGAERRAVPVGRGLGAAGAAEERADGALSSDARRPRVRGGRGARCTATPSTRPAASSP